MAERLWNMLKLVPSISASRKNSLITGLARIDDNTEELILSLYHLPDPKDFTEVKNATYCAWSYDSEVNRWGVIGELKKKNGLTFSFRKKVDQLSDGIFITAEAQGVKPMKPGEVLLASNPELFYQKLEVEPEVVEVQPSEERRPPAKAEDVVDIIPEEPVEMAKPELGTEKAIDCEPAQEEETIQVEVADLSEEETLETPLANVQEEETPETPLPELKVEETPETILSDREPELPSESELVFMAKTGHDSGVEKAEIREEEQEEEPIQELPVSEEIHEKLIHFYNDIPVENVLGLIKDRYSTIKGEVDLREYWDKCKEYCNDLYEETKLKDIYGEIKKDLKNIMDQLELDQLWCKLEDFIQEMLDLFDMKKWAKKTKEWMDAIDINEWYCKMKDYMDVILDEVDLGELWFKVRCWIENLLEKMSVEEMMIWIKLKVQTIREMDVDELRVEAIDLFKQFVDQIKMPELKMAVMKVAFKEKINQVGDFFKRIKNKVDTTSKDSSVERQHQTPKENKKLYVDMQKYQRPAQFRTEVGQKPAMNPDHNMYNDVDDELAAGYGHFTQQGHPNVNMYNTMEEPTAFDTGFYSKMYNPYMFKTTPAYGYPGMAQNPYYPTHQYNQHPMMYSYPGYGYGANKGNMSYCPCQQCQNCFQFGYDAMGDPRYFYDEEDEGYFFITPDGEIIRKS